MKFTGLKIDPVSTKATGTRDTSKQGLISRFSSFKSLMKTHKRAESPPLNPATIEMTEIKPKPTTQQKEEWNNFFVLKTNELKYESVKEGKFFWENVCSDMSAPELSDKVNKLKDVFDTLEKNDFYDWINQYPRIRFFLLININKNFIQRLCQIFKPDEVIELYKNIRKTNLNYEENHTKGPFFCYEYSKIKQVCKLNDITALKKRGWLSLSGILTDERNQEDVTYFTIIRNEWKKQKKMKTGYAGQYAKARIKIKSNMHILAIHLLLKTPFRFMVHNGLAHSVYALKRARGASVVESLETTNNFCFVADTITDILLYIPNAIIGLAAAPISYVMSKMGAFIDTCWLSPQSIDIEQSTKYVHHLLQFNGYESSEIYKVLFEKENSTIINFLYGLESKLTAPGWHPLFSNLAIKKELLAHNENTRQLIKLILQDEQHQLTESEASKGIGDLAWSFDKISNFQLGKQIAIVNFVLYLLENKPHSPYESIQLVKKLTEILSKCPESTINAIKEDLNFFLFEEYDPSAASTSSAPMNPTIPHDLPNHEILNLVDFFAFKMLYTYRCLYSYNDFRSERSMNSVFREWGREVTLRRDTMRKVKHHIKTHFNETKSAAQLAILLDFYSHQLTENPDANIDDIYNGWQVTLKKIKLSYDDFKRIKFNDHSRNLFGKLLQLDKNLIDSFFDAVNSKFDAFEGYSHDYSQIIEVFFKRLELNRLTNNHLQMAIVAIAQSEPVSLNSNRSEKARSFKNNIISILERELDEDTRANVHWGPNETESLSNWDIVFKRFNLSDEQITENIQACHSFLKNLDEPCLQKLFKCTDSATQILQYLLITTLSLENKINLYMANIPEDLSQEEKRQRFNTYLESLSEEDKREILASRLPVTTDSLLMVFGKDRDGRLLNHGNYGFLPLLDNVELIDSVTASKLNGNECWGCMWQYIEEAKSEDEKNNRKAALISALLENYEPNFERPIESQRKCVNGMMTRLGQRFAIEDFPGMRCSATEEIEAIMKLNKYTADDALGILVEEISKPKYDQKKKQFLELANQLKIQGFYFNGKFKDKLIQNQILLKEGGKTQFEDLVASYVSLHFPDDKEEELSTNDAIREFFLVPDMSSELTSEEQVSIKDIISKANEFLEEKQNNGIKIDAFEFIKQLCEALGEDFMNEYKPKHVSLKARLRKIEHRREQHFGNQPPQKKAIKNSHLNDLIQTDDDSTLIKVERLQRKEFILGLKRSKSF